MKVRVSFDLELPEGTHPYDASEWLGFELGVTSSMREINPLLDKSIEARNLAIDTEHIHPGTVRAIVIEQIIEREIGHYHPGQSGFTGDSENTPAPQGPAKAQ